MDVQSTGTVRIMSLKKEPGAVSGPNQGRCTGDHLDKRLPGFISSLNYSIVCTVRRVQRVKQQLSDNSNLDGDNIRSSSGCIIILSIKATAILIILYDRQQFIGTCQALLSNQDQHPISILTQYLSTMGFCNIFSFSVRKMPCLAFCLLYLFTVPLRFTQRTR